MTIAQEPWFKILKKYRQKNIRDRKSPPRQRKEIQKANPILTKIRRSKAAHARWQNPEYRENLIKKQIGWRQYPCK